MLVAVSILAIGALAVVTMQRATVNANQSASAEQVAAALAAQLLEAARPLAYRDTRLAPTGGGWVAPASSLSPANPLNGNGQTATTGYTRLWQISDNAPAANMKTIAVQVSWSRANQSNQLTLSTIKAK